MKLFSGLTVWALLLAAVASFVFGGVWYSALSKQWMAAANLTKERIAAAGGALAPTIITFFCQLFMAWMLAGIILHMAKAGIPATAVNGLISGAFIWAGFIATILIVSQRYQLQSWRLTLIDGGHWLGVLLIQGAILGRFGMAG